VRIIYPPRPTPILRGTDVHPEKDDEYRDFLRRAPLMARLNESVDDGKKWRRILDASGQRRPSEVGKKVDIEEEGEGKSLYRFHVNDTVELSTYLKSFPSWQLFHSLGEKQYEQRTYYAFHAIHYNQTLFWTGPN
jgi:hypothetical protein